MDRRTRFLGVWVIIATLIAFSSAVFADEAGQSYVRQFHPGNAAIGSEAAWEGRGVPAEPYGVPVTPPIYLVNFLLLYIANPNNAANMPAYRAAIPWPLYDCLQKNPEGCLYADFERFFDEQVLPRGGCLWPNDCQEDPEWADLAPSIAMHPDQINEPLGIKRAERIAQRLGIDASMILTEMEYQCTIGTPTNRTPDQETIVLCIENLTNSKGNADIPLSSYGLSITDQGYVQSDCAPEAPCLVFNQLFAGPLERLAIECGWAIKLERMARETPFFHFVYDGNQCQKNAEPVCAVEPICLPFRPRK